MFYATFRVWRFVFSFDVNDWRYKPYFFWLNSPYYQSLHIGISFFGFTYERARSEEETLAILDRKEAEAAARVEAQALALEAVRDLSEEPKKKAPAKKKKAPKKYPYTKRHPRYGKP